MASMRAQSQHAHKWHLQHLMHCTCDSL